MLNKIRFIIWLVIMLLVAYFVSMNSTSISVNLIPGYQTVPLPLSIVIIVSLIIGAILAVILTVGDWIKFKLEIKKLRKQLENCEKEKQVFIQLKDSNQPKSGTENNV
ncbi:MAG: lipopolysaccharide assembly protein LapA domain-containing protein [Sulfurihydrogenibium sp.]|uniref:lipopolysaccharide assembly protein LapA domain-containing protein n=1 Tax=Sulfurihydrogenibium sp. TaxID=2053621 RepID=UPI003C7E1CA1